MLPPISKHRPLWILLAGFALVIGTLALLAWLGFRQAEAIRRQAASLVEEHMAVAHLTDELELAQHRASKLLLDIIRPKPRQQDKELADFEESLPGLVQEGGRVLPSPLWAELEVAAHAYAGELRLAFADDPLRGNSSAARLQQRYDEFVHLADQVLRLESTRAAAGERLIELATDRMANETGGLLGGALVLALGCAFFTIQFTLNALRRIEWQASELARVSWHMLQGQEDAARRFSHELHDELGQSLTGLKAILSGLPPQEFSERRGACLHLLDDAIRNVRELSQLLRPVILDDFGLAAALRWLAERFQERTRILVNVEADYEGRLADEVETHLFRITQEALTNVARHAGATLVHVVLTQQGEELSLTITDNGVGLSPQQQQRPSLGLVGMRARAEQLGGYCRLSNVPNGGVQVTARVPLRLPEEEVE